MILVGVFVAVVGALLQSPATHAAACTPPGTDYGAVNFTANVSTSGEYDVWLRSASLQNTDTVSLQVNGTECFEIGGSDTPTYSSSSSSRFASNSENWIHTNSTDAEVRISLASGANTLTLIGMSEGFVVDRFIATSDNTCVPTGTGDNCASIFLAPDFNKDAKVDFRDFSRLAALYTKTGASLGSVDINHDGVVNILDYSALASLYGVSRDAIFSDTQLMNGSVQGAASLVNDTSSSGGLVVSFGTDSTASCVGDPNTAGGPDPWGGCWPGPHNTGYPQGLQGDARTPVLLTPYTGPAEIDTCGVVIENKLVNTWLLLKVGNGTHSKDTPCLTIRNSKIIGTINTLDIANGPILIEDTEIDTTNEAMQSGIPFVENLGRYNIFSYRVNSHGGDPTIKCAAYCESKDSMAHSPTLGGANRHYNAFGGNGIEAGAWNIEHNYASCGDWSGSSTGSPPSGDSGCSADIGFYGDFAPVRNITIHRNLLRGQADNPLRLGIGNQSAYCLNPGYYVGKPYPAPTYMTITENVFQRGTYSNACGVFGPTNSLNQVGAGETNVWSGNVYSDGAPINRVEE